MFFWFQNTNSCFQVKSVNFLMRGRGFKSCSAGNSTLSHNFHFSLEKTHLHSTFKTCYSRRDLRYYNFVY